MTDEERKELVDMIHEGGLTIAQAATALGVKYDNAKAINRTYLKQKRTVKIGYRQRHFLNKSERDHNIKEKAAFQENVTN